MNAGKIKDLRFFLFLIFGIVLFLQLVKINRPYLGNFSSYQAGMINLAQNMERDGPKGWLLPKLNQLIAGERGLHLNQYPLPSLIAAICHRWIPLSYEFWGRIQMIFFHILSLFLFFLILRSLWGEGIALISTSLYALSPYTLIYGQSFLSESPAMFFFLASMYLIARASPSRISTLGVFMSGVLFSVSILNRIHFVVMFLPLLYLLYRRSARKVIHSFLFVATGLSLPVAWYLWVYQIIQTSPHAQMHMFMQVGAGKILTRSLLGSLDYYRYLFDLTSGKILTPLIFPFFLIGLLGLRKTTEKWFLWLWLGTFAILIAGLPRKVMDHEFYLLPAAPALFVAAAFGIKRILGWRSLLQRRNFIFCVSILLLVSARYFLHPIYYYPEKEAALLKIADRLKQLVERNELLIVAHGGAPELLYFAERNGWTFNERGQGEIPIYWRTNKFQKLTAEESQEREQAYERSVDWLEYLRKQGAAYFVASDKSSLEGNKELFHHLQRHYAMVGAPEDFFYLFRLEK